MIGFTNDRNVVTVVKLSLYTFSIGYHNSNHIMNIVQHSFSHTNNFSVLTFALGVE